MFEIKVCMVSNPIEENMFKISFYLSKLIKTLRELANWRHSVEYANYYDLDLAKNINYGNNDV